LLGGREGRWFQMNEAQRFLRYVTPGLVFLAETLFLLLILLPGWTLEQVKAVKEGEALGVVFATLLASGGVGFVFSLVHHVVHWARPRPGLDHSKLISRLRNANVIQLVDAESGLEIAEDAKVSPANAWIIVTSLWHERLTKSDHIKAAEPKASVLVDMTHTTGTARVACAFAWITTFLIAGHAAQVSFEPEPVFRFIGANVLAGLLFFVHHWNCKRVRYLAQGVIEEVLHDALVAEKEQPVKTRVALTRS